MPEVEIETGLLEQPELLLAPETIQGGAGPVGVVRAVTEVFWRRWLLGATLTVHENEQEPLVFSIRRRWTLLARWDVFDADEELVGTIGGGWVIDPWEQPLFRLSPDGTFDSFRRQRLGRWAPPRLEFCEEVRSEPFLKMLMLAVVLAR